MRLSTSLSVVPALLSTAYAAVDLHSIKKGTAGGPAVVPGGYIVELDTANALGRRDGLTVS